MNYESNRPDDVKSMITANQSTSRLTQMSSPPKAKKVLLISDHYMMGGVASVNYELAQGFKELGYHVTLLSAFSDKLFKTVPAGIEYDCVVSSGWESWERKLFIPYLFKLAKHLKKYYKDIDLIVSSKDTVNVFVIVAKRMALIKASLICNSHTSVTHLQKYDKGIFLKLILKLCKFFYKRGDYIANVSMGATKDSERFFNLEKVFYLPNPVRVNHNITTPKNEIFPAHGINILACGRLVYPKNYALMIRSLKVAIGIRKDIFLTILGNGYERTKLELLVKELDLENHVHFLGTVENTYEYMYYADGLWVTSRYEGFGMVIIEALFQGCPILSVDCPYGPRELLENGKYGMLVNSYDIKENAKALLNFIENKKFSKDFYKNRANNFDRVTCAKNYLKVAGLGNNTSVQTI